MHMHDIRCFIDFRGYCVNDEMQSFMPVLYRFHCYVIAHLTMYMPVFNDFNNLTSMKSFLAGLRNVVLILILDEQFVGSQQNSN